MFLDVNDYELLYLIKENNEKALNLMYYKYSFMVEKNIAKLNISKVFHDEFVQEGYMILNNCIRQYNDQTNKSFCRYFELCLKRRFYRLINEFHLYENVYYLKDENITKPICLAENEYPIYIVNSVISNELEQRIAREILFNHASPNYFAKKYHLPIKKVYNLIYKVKEILKKHLS